VIDVLIDVLLFEELNPPLIHTVYSLLCKCILCINVKYIIPIVNTSAK
jgi:hypothetical protein